MGVASALIVQARKEDGGGGDFLSYVHCTSYGNGAGRGACGQVGVSAGKRCMWVLAAFENSNQPFPFSYPAISNPKTLLSVFNPF